MKIPFFTRFHRYNSFFLGVFIILHLINHIIGFFGVEVHLAFMNTLRRLYYIPIVQTLLVISVLEQIITGVVLLFKFRRKRGAWAKIQRWSGIYLAIFLLVHTAAALYYRIQGIDTNFYYGAGTLHANLPLAIVFSIYYFLSVTALFSHIASLFYSKTKNTSFAIRATVSGMILSILILLMLFGVYYEINFPMEIKQLYHHESEGTF